MYIAPYRKLAIIGQKELNGLAARIENLKAEGRNQEWTGEQTAAAIAAARGKLADLNRERKTQLILDQAQAREVKREQPYSERAYHLQKAATLAQGLEGEQLLTLYQDLIKDPESRANKSEYEQLIRRRLYDPAHRLTFDQLAQAQETPAEQEQRRDRQGLRALDAHLQTLAGLEQEALEELGKGRQPPNLAGIFENLLQNVEAHHQGGPSSEYKADLEKRAGAE